VAILDISIPRQDGIEAAQKISESCPVTTVLLISGLDRWSVTSHMMMAGIMGFVSKDSLSSELFLAIEALLCGETYFKSESSQCDVVNWSLRLSVRCVLYLLAGVATAKLNGRSFPALNID